LTGTLAGGAASKSYLAVFDMEHPAITSQQSEATGTQRRCCGGYDASGEQRVFIPILAFTNWR